MWAACSNHRRCPFGCGSWRSIFPQFFFSPASLSFFRNPSPSAGLSASFRDPKPSARSSCVALSGAGITMTLRQLKHFYRKHNNLPRRKAHQQKKIKWNKRVRGKQVSRLALWGYIAAPLKSKGMRFRRAERSQTKKNKHITHNFIQP